MTDCSTEVPQKRKPFKREAPILDDPEELLRKPKVKKTPSTKESFSQNKNVKVSPQKKKGPNSIQK